MTGSPGETSVGGPLLGLKIDNCAHCPCITPVYGPRTVDGLVRAMEDGDVGCWNCDEAGQHHMEVDVYLKGIKVWCGHAPKCPDAAPPIPLRPHTETGPLDGFRGAP